MNDGLYYLIPEIDISSAETWLVTSHYDDCRNPNLSSETHRHVPKGVGVDRGRSGRNYECPRVHKKQNSLGASLLVFCCSKKLQFSVSEASSTVGSVTPALHSQTFGKASSGAKNAVSSSKVCTPGAPTCPRESSSAPEYYGEALLLRWRFSMKNLPTLTKG